MILVKVMAMVINNNESYNCYVLKFGNYIVLDNNIGSNADYNPMNAIYCNSNGIIID